MCVRERQKDNVKEKQKECVRQGERICDSKRDRKNARVGEKQKECEIRRETEGICVITRATEGMFDRKDRNMCNLKETKNVWE